MIVSEAPVRTHRVRLGLNIAFVALLISLAGGALWLLGPGSLRIDTRLADLAPEGVGSLPSRTASQLVADARDGASRRLTIHLESSNTLALGQAAKEVRDALAVTQGFEPADDAARIDPLVEKLTAHRFSLLSPSDRGALERGDTEALIDEALSDLYSPAVTPRPLDLPFDPTNVLGRWLLTITDAAPQASSDVPTLRVEAVLDEAFGNSDAAVLDWRAALDRIREAHPSVSIYQTGVPLFAQEAAQRSRADVDRITIGSLIGLTVLLLPVFRSIWPMLVPALSIAVGAATGFMLVALLQPSVHVLTLVFGASLIGIVIDYSIHGHVHLRSHAAGAESSSGLYRALTLSLVTSMVGYGALIISGVPALASIAVFSVGGLLGAWLTVVVLLPITTRRASGVHGSLIDVVANLLTRASHYLTPRRSVFWIAVLAALAVALFGSRADDDPRRLIDLSPALIQDAELIAQRWPDRRSTEIVVVSADNLDDVYEKLRAAERVVGPDGSLLSLNDWLPAPFQQQDNRQRARALFDEGGVAAVVLDAVGVADVPTALRGSLEAIDYDDEHPLDTAALFDDESLGLPPLLVRRDDQYVALAFPEGSIDAAALQNHAAEHEGIWLLDAVTDAESALAEQRRATFRVLAFAIAGIAVFLLLVYRRWSAVVLVAVPLVAIIGTLAVFAAAGISLTLFHAVGLFLVLGLGMDYAVFLRELDQESPGSTRLAIVLSAATSLLSFGLLAASSIPVARFFGQTVLIGNALNLVLTFAILATTRPRAPDSAAV